MGLDTLSLRNMALRAFVRLGLATGWFVGWTEYRASRGERPYRLPCAEASGCGQYDNSRHREPRALVPRHAGKKGGGESHIRRARNSPWFREQFAETPGTSATRWIGDRQNPHSARADHSELWGRISLDHAGGSAKWSLDPRFSGGE